MMKCTEVSLQHRAISHSRIFFFFLSLFFLLQVVVYLNIFFSDLATLTFSLAQCRTTRTTTDDDWLCQKNNDNKKNKARHFEVRTMLWAKAALETAFGFTLNGG